MNEDELLPLLKQLAEGVLKQKLVVEDLRIRLSRLEHVLEHQMKAEAGQILAEIENKKNAPIAQR